MARIFIKVLAYLLLVWGGLVALGWIGTFAPRTATPSGDPNIVAELKRLRTRQTRRIAAAVVDLNASPTLRIGCLGVHDGTVFEVGSLAKGLTGMLLADAIRRGEVTLHTTVAGICAEYSGTPFGSVTIKELCTHTSGLPRLPRSVGMGIRVLAWGLVGLDPYRRIGASPVLAAAARQVLRRRGSYCYSNLGAAVMGQLLARNAGVDYPTLLRERLSVPLGLGDTRVASRPRHAPAGLGAVGGWRQPWIPDGYAPAGGVLSTISDLGGLATALLNGSAPGLSSLQPLIGTERRGIGMFWLITAVGKGSDLRTMIWHNGLTGGYASFFALYPQTRQAVVVLSNSQGTSNIETMALALADWMKANAKPSGI